MTLALSITPEAIAKASWSDIRPHFDALATRDFDHDSVEAWLADWSRLEAMLTEAASRATIRYTVDTRDKAAEQDHLRFSMEILPQAEERSVALQKRLVARAQKNRVGERVRLMIDGPASDHELVIRGRLEGQAPDIDSLVYLTDCDPAELTAGTVIEAGIVSFRGYDLVARPA